MMLLSNVGCSRLIWVVAWWVVTCRWCSRGCLGFVRLELLMVALSVPCGFPVTGLLYCGGLVCADVSCFQLFL